MYTLEDTERIARNEITRESVRLYLMDKLAESIRTLSDITDNQSTEISDVLGEGLSAIGNSLNDLSNKAKRLDDISLSLHEISEGLLTMNDYICELEDKLNDLNETIRTLNHGEGGDK